MRVSGLSFEIDLEREVYEGGIEMESGLCFGSSRLSNRSGNKGHGELHVVIQHSHGCSPRGTTVWQISDW